MCVPFATCRACFEWNVLWRGRHAFCLPRMGFAGNLFDFTPCLGKVSPKGNRGYLNFSIGLRATRRIRQLDRIVPFLSLSVSLSHFLFRTFFVYSHASGSPLCPVRQRTASRLNRFVFAFVFDRYFPVPSSLGRDFGVRNSPQCRSETPTLGSCRKR